MPVLFVYVPQKERWSNMGKYFVVYVTLISCIVSSSKWIIIVYRAVLTIGIGMAFAICGTETDKIKTVFPIARINVALMFHF